MICNLIYETGLLNSSYPLAVQAEWVLSLPASVRLRDVRLSVRPSIRKLYLVPTITRHRFELESPNLHQTCIMYLVFYNTSPPRMFLSLDLLWEYRIQHGANGPLYVTSSYSTWIFCRGVSGFATDCPCGVWCRGLTTCLLHVGPPFGNRILNNSWAVGLT